MKLLNKILFLSIIVVFANSLLAQTIVTSKCYETDFEDDSEWQNWELNRGPLGSECANKWYFGKLGTNRGQRGLYVSNDGLSNKYVGKGVSVVALRKIILEKGNYELSFDWQAGGVKAENSRDGLYVCWVPVSDTIFVNSAVNNNLQKFVSRYSLYIDGSDHLLEKSWNSVNGIKINSDGNPHYLVFVWNNGALEYYPGGCVDNIYIMEEGLCSTPNKFNVNTKGYDVVLSWQGDATAYDIRIYCHALDKWYEYNGITTPYLEVDSLEQGMKTYYIRSVCDSVHGAWSSKDAFLFFPDAHCVNYLGLNNKNCFWGNTMTPESTSGVVDFGPKSVASRHTLHYDKKELDSRSNNKLQTVPDGSLASVRLGNWNSGGQAECILYDYRVDTLKGAVLLLNYAVVLQDPGHDYMEEQPRFSLEILRRGVPLDTFGCGEAFFASGFNMDSTWHQFYSEAGNPGGWWKEWTTIAINLGQYHGQNLQIKLTTYDCSLGGHYGYAYFTLGCSDGKIQGLSCGNSSNNAFKGPDGFKYRWYLPSNPEDILSTEQSFAVESNDTLTYYLDVIQPTNENCYYTLSASAVSRFPRAYAEYSSSIKNCQHVVKFQNKSYITRHNQVTHKTEKTDELCETFVWDFGDGTTSTEENPTHVYALGGTYTVKLFSGIADRVCEDDTIFTIVLPEINNYIDTTYATVCQGKSYEFKGERYFNAGIYVDSMKTIYGCDSIEVLNLYVASKYDSLVVDTICSHEEYYFDTDGDGKKDQVTETGKYEVKYESVYGCDSIVTLDILVNESLLLNFDTLVVACGGDASTLIPYQKVSGLFDMCEATIDLGDSVYSVSADIGSETDAIVLPLPERIKPGYYNLNLNFGEKACGDEEKNIPMQIRYPKDVVVQRWGDVLAVKNEDYNGGYEFVAFQWFKNGTPIVGATSSILYLTEGLDINAEYAVLLTRLVDNVSIMTCVAELIDSSSANDSKVIVFGQNSGKEESVEVKVSDEARVKVWSVNGWLIDEFMLSEGYNIVECVGVDGVCLLEFIFVDGYREIRKVIIQ